MPKRPITIPELFARVRRSARGKKPSRVKELLAKGKVPVAKKLGEEGGEAALAVAAESKGRVIAEFGDVLYQMAVSAHMRGITLDEIYVELGKRVRNGTKTPPRKRKQKKKRKKG